jgi:5-methylcytosine-specific restriction endonuclease McrA
MNVRQVTVRHECTPEETVGTGSGWLAQQRWVCRFCTTYSHRWSNYWVNWRALRYEFGISEELQPGQAENIPELIENIRRFTEVPDVFGGGFHNEWHATRLLYKNKYCLHYRAFTVWPRRYDERRRVSIIERDGKCLRCGCRSKLVVDHIVPHLFGGTDSWWNLQTLCHACDSWKGVRIIDFRPGDYNQLYSERAAQRRAKNANRIDA